jgi:hypothetical protein
MPRFYNQILNYNHLFHQYVWYYDNRQQVCPYTVASKMWYPHGIPQSLKCITKAGKNFISFVGPLLPAQGRSSRGLLLHLTTYPPNATPPKHTNMNTHVHISTHTQIHSRPHPNLCTYAHLWTHTYMRTCTYSVGLQRWIITYNQEFFTVESNTTLSFYIYNASQRLLSLYYCTLCKPNEPQRNNGWIKGAYRLTKVRK